MRIADECVYGRPVVIPDEVYEPQFIECWTKQQAYDVLEKFWQRTGYSVVIENEEGYVYEDCGDYLVCTNIVSYRRK